MHRSALLKTQMVIFTLWMIIIINNNTNVKNSDLTYCVHASLVHSNQSLPRIHTCEIPKHSWQKRECVENATHSKLTHRTWSDCGVLWAYGLILLKIGSNARVFMTTASMLAVIQSIQIHSEIWGRRYLRQQPNY